MTRSTLNCINQQRMLCAEYTYLAQHTYFLILNFSSAAILATILLRSSRSAWFFACSAELLSDSSLSTAPTSRGFSLRLAPTSISSVVSMSVGFAGDDGLSALGA